MKIFSLQVDPHGERLVTGSTSIAAPPRGADAAISAAAAGVLSSGAAVSVLPQEYQQRLLDGGTISIEEMGAIDIDVVK